MLEFLHRGLEIVNALIAIGILYLGFRIWSALSFALQKRAVQMFIAASLFFALAEVLGAVNAAAESDTVELLKEAAETTFIVFVAAATYFLYQSERREVTSLRHSADTDALTKLHNHAHFRRTAVRRVAQAVRYNLPLALIMLDIDNFKAYNDQFGHEAGNYALQRIAQVLRETLRADDLTARYGGEEFVMLVVGESASLLAERIRAVIESRCSPGQDANLRRPITASLGLAVLNSRAGSLEELIAEADREMYRAKQAGKNRVSGAGQTA